MTKITKRDPETGRILPGGRKLSSEEAVEMGKISHKKRNIDSANVLLAEDGFDDDSPAPEHLRILAEYAVSGKAGSVAALRDYRRLTRKDAAATDVAKPEKPKPGSICSLCGEIVMTDFRPDASQLDAANEFINRHRKSYLRPEPEPDPADMPAPTGNPFDDGINGE